MSDSIAVITLQFGSVIEFEGHQYVVMQSDSKHDDAGRSLSLWCMDLFMAQARNDQRVMENTMREHQGVMLRMLPKIERQIDDGEQPRGD